jgi:hypothetical protein
MSFHVHIPVWLLWGGGGFIVGWVASNIYGNIVERNAIGRMFGW